MITLFVEKNNPLTPNFYYSFISNLQFHRLQCPCGHAGSLSVHGYYNRYFKTPEGKLCFRICRVICKSCGKTHALLLSSMVPYSQVSLCDHVASIDAFESDEPTSQVLNSNPSLDESSLRYIIRKYLLHWKQRLLSCSISLHPRELLSRLCFAHHSRQFMQIKSTLNSLFINTT